MFSDIEISERPPAAPSETTRTTTMQWIEAATAIVAMLAAVAGLIASKSAHQSLRAKNDAILIRATVTDDYLQYEARSIRQDVYEAQLAANPRLPKDARARMSRIVEEERVAKQPLLELANAQERSAGDAAELGERYANAYDVMEIGVVFLELAIALVAIAALRSSRVLIAVSMLSVVGGIFFLLFGYSLR